MSGQGWSNRPQSRIGVGLAALMRCFISAAALFVKVIARIDAGSAPLRSKYATRRVMTRVLPLPAAATMSSGPSVCVTASICGGVKSASRGSTEGIELVGVVT